MNTKNYNFGESSAIIAKDKVLDAKDEIDNVKSEEQKIKFGVIGVGYWGPNYVRILNMEPSAEIKWIADLDTKKLSNIKSVYPNIKTTNDYKDILEDKEVEAIIICTPTTTHFKIAKDCIKAAKHVLVEKPLTYSSDEAKKLIESANTNDVKLMVGHIFEFNPAVRYIKECIDKKNIGEVMYAHSARTGLGPIRHDVNAMWDLASHDISILLYLFGKKPVDIVARGVDYLKDGNEDVVFINMAFGNKVMANIHVSWIDPTKTRKLTVVGTEKMITFDDVDMSEKVRIYDKGVSYQHPYANFGEFQLMIRDGDINIPKIKFKEPLKEQVLHFIDCIKNNKCPITDGINGYNVVKVLEAAHESLKRKGERVNIEW